MLSLSEDLRNDLKVWPLDWDLHIIKTADLYFDSDKKVQCLKLNSNFQAMIPGEPHEPTYEEMRQYIVFDSIQMGGLFRYDDRLYVTQMTADCDNTVVGNIYRVYEYDEENDTFHVKAAAMVRGASAYDLIVAVEDVITEDYLRCLGVEEDDMTDLDEEEQDDSGDTND